MKLITNDGVTHNSPNYILKEEVKYFKNMFSFQSPPSPLTEGQITVEELLYAIKAFKAGKTPGLDGIPVEVYNTYLIYSEDHY